MRLSASTVVGICHQVNERLRNNKQQGDEPGLGAGPRAGRLPTVLTNAEESRAQYTWSALEAAVCQFWSESNRGKRQDAPRAPERRVVLEL